MFLAEHWCCCCYSVDLCGVLKRSPFMLGRIRRLLLVAVRCGGICSLECCTSPAWPVLDFKGFDWFRAPIPECWLRLSLFFQITCTSKGPQTPRNSVYIWTSELSEMAMERERERDVHITCLGKRRWSPRTRMPTRMLSNRDNTYLSYFFPRTHLWDTLTWHDTEVTLL